jgi:hypothetical protein
MRNGISITVSRPDRRRLRALVADRNGSQMHVWRAKIALLPARECTDNCQWPDNSPGNTNFARAIR